MTKDISDFDLGFEVGYREILSEAKKNWTEEDYISNVQQKQTGASFKQLLGFYGYDTSKIKATKKGGSLRIELQDLSINLKEIEAIAKNFERYQTDAKTGEILAGGNFFIFVNYNYSIEKNLRSELSGLAKKIEDSTNDDSPFEFTWKSGNKLTYFPTNRRTYFNGKSILGHDILSGLINIVMDRLVTVEELKQIEKVLE